MTKRTAEWALFSVILIAMMLTTASVSADLVLAVKKSSSSSSGSTLSSAKAVHKTTKRTTTTTNTAVHHVKGVKVFHVHSVPSKVVVGNTFGFRGVVFNNSTATITFANGTCASPVSITFNKNVITEPQTRTTTCKAQQVTLRPGQQSPILSPNLSGIIYRATAPGMTNATITFKYGALIPPSKSSLSDSITRVHTFIILPSSQSTSLRNPSSTPGSQPGVKPIP